MSILQLKNITVIYGNPPLLDGVELVVQPKERVCLVGRNGSGKSTLMKVIAGDIIADDGQRIIENNTVGSDLGVPSEFLIILGCSRRRRGDRVGVPGESWLHPF